MKGIAVAGTLLALLVAVGAEAQAPVGVEFRVDNHTSITVSPDVGMDASGGFVVTWSITIRPTDITRARAVTMPLAHPAPTSRSPVLRKIPASLSTREGA